MNLEAGFTFQAGLKNGVGDARRDELRHQVNWTVNGKGWKTEKEMENPAKLRKRGLTPSSTVFSMPPMDIIPVATATSCAPPPMFCATAKITSSWAAAMKRARNAPWKNSSKKFLRRLPQPVPVGRAGLPDFLDAKRQRPL